MIDELVAQNVQLIADHLARWDRVPDIVRVVFGDADPEAMAAALDGFCRRELGSAIADAEFFIASVGSVHGLRLADGRRVVVKLHGSRANAAFLRAVQEVQRHLFDEGFPAPEPLAGPVGLQGGIAVAEGLLDRGQPEDAHEPSIRLAMVSALAEFIARCRPLSRLENLGHHVMVVGEGRLWPRPHDDRFDFEATTAGAEWIDRVATAAARVLGEGAGDRVVGHSDWRAEHLRFSAGRVSAVYDWDSVILEREPVLVGSVAHGFTANWDVELERQRPTLGEALAFIAEYEAARGTPFAPAERRAARASLAYSMSYSARCEHSDAALMPWGEPEAPDDSARAFIAAHAEELLKG